jgi:very-short-patch-repair endonuclease
MKYNATLADFPTYNKKHLKIINKGKTFEEIWGDPKSKKRVKAISDARKQRFFSGEYDYIKDAIKEGRKDPELGDKISKGAKGKPKPKPKGFGVGRKHSEETKGKMSDSAVQRILKDPKSYHTSKLEEKFKIILDILDINYQHFFFADKIKKIFDFYLPDHNILIEVDGNFYHCNPKFYNTPVCKTQEINIKNDKIKNEWALNNGYKLLRFWEDDINNNIKQVKNILLESLKK